MGGPQGRSGRVENFVPTWIRSRTVQPVVSPYTDWATRPTTDKECVLKIVLPPLYRSGTLTAHYFIRKKNHQQQLTTKHDSSKKRQYHQTICQLLQIANKSKWKEPQLNCLRSRQRDFYDNSLFGVSSTTLTLSVFAYQQVWRGILIPQEDPFVSLRM